MEVINVNDGKNLGKVIDIAFSSPENRVLGLTAAGGKGFRFNKDEVLLPIKSIIKIGEDVVLTNFNHARPDKCPPPESKNRIPQNSRISYEEYE